MVPVSLWNAPVGPSSSISAKVARPHRGRIVNETSLRTRRGDSLGRRQELVRMTSRSVARVIAT
jgi:hypothetical protein